MSFKTRSARRQEKESLEKEVRTEEEDDSEEDEEDDLPPPVLEREMVCEENDSDGSEKMAENRQSESPKSESSPDVIIEETDEDTNKGTDLLQALSHVFSANNDEEKFSDPFPKAPIGRPRKNFEFVKLSSQSLAAKAPLPLSKTMLLSTRKTPTLSSRLNAASLPTTSTTRFTSLRQMQRGPYGTPPPLPGVLRNGVPITGVGSNTSIGPARLLENRKRPSLPMEKEKEAKRSLLVAYNGGRAGETFRKVGNSASTSSGPSTSSSSATTSSTSGTFDAVSMLSEQAPVQIQVTAGGTDRDVDGAQEAFEIAALQKDSIGSVTKSASHHNILLGSMVINGLNNLQSRNSEDYHNLSSDLYALFSKYRIQ